MVHKSLIPARSKLQEKAFGEFVLCLVERRELGFGNKYNITPIRRELLSDLRAVIAIDGNLDLEQDVRSGIRGDLRCERYGIPFMGDNSFMVDRVEVLETPPSAHWYQRLSSDQIGTTNRSSRMTLSIDRADSSLTKTELFAPMEVPTNNIPSDAWVHQGVSST